MEEEEEGTEESAMSTLWDDSKNGTELNSGISDSKPWGLSLLPCDFPEKLIDSYQEGPKLFIPVSSTSAAHWPHWGSFLKKRIPGILTQNLWGWTQGQALLSDWGEQSGHTHWLPSSHHDERHTDLQTVARPGTTMKGTPIYKWWHGILFRMDLLPYFSFWDSTLWSPDGLRFMAILLLQSPECWDYRWEE